MRQVIAFEDLGSTDLIVDAIYDGKDNSLASDPISRLLPGCGNMGGFRLAGTGQDKQFVALFTTGLEKDWPDRIDLNTGQFTYYGDNRTPGHELHTTLWGAIAF
jgi:Restriction endonuclease AspBHI N-terminal